MTTKRRLTERFHVHAGQHRSRELREATGETATRIEIRDEGKACQFYCVLAAGDQSGQGCEFGILVNRDQNEACVSRRASAAQAIPATPAATRTGARPIRALPAPTWFLWEPERIP